MGLFNRSKKKAETPGPDPRTFPVDSKVEHRVMGRGTILDRQARGDKWVLTIRFDRDFTGTRKLLTDFVEPLVDEAGPDDREQDDREPIDEEQDERGPDDRGPDDEGIGIDDGGAGPTYGDSEDR